MGLFFILFLLCFLGLTGAGQESFQVLNIHDTTQEAHSVHPLAVSVRDGDINRVSNSVLEAESWLKTHVLAYFPTTKITTIVVDEAIQCQNGHDTRFHLILPSLKNLHYSLTRWGLETEIKVSTAISSNCFDQDLAIWKDDLAEKFTKPLLEFLHRTNSTYTVNLPPHFSTLLDETVTLVSSYTEFVKKVGSLSLNKVNVIVTGPGQVKHVNRKLLSIDTKTVELLPARPNPLPEISHSRLHTSNGFSVPANVAKKPHPPPSQVASQPPLTVPRLTYPPPTSFPINSPPPMNYPVAPEQPPFLVPATAPFGYSSPPCNPTGNMAPSPQTGFVQELWCVAKPSVPADTLQEAMDYACGEGGANREEIKPNGSCFYPDTVVAHAFYAFNKQRIALFYSMDPQCTGDIFKRRHLEKQNELLKDAYNFMSQELHKLQVEEEMLMRKFYELMTTHGLTKRNEGDSKVSNDEEIGHHTALLTNTNSHISNADDDNTENHTTLDTEQQ